MQQRKIIIFFIVLFIASSFWLFYQSDKERNPDLSGEWWAAYFMDPKSDNLNFSVENHSNKFNFHWEILANQDKIEEGDINIPRGETINTSIQDLNPDTFKDKKIIIMVSADNETKEIYKNF